MMRRQFAHIRSFVYRGGLRNLLDQHFSTFLLERNLLKMFALLMEHYD